VYDATSKVMTLLATAEMPLGSKLSLT